MSKTAPDEVEVQADRLLIPGLPDEERCDNKVVSARYTFYNFLPIATMEQFRRFANLYFLVVGGIMFIGEYTDAYETAISPWTTWGPLAVVIAISLSVEGSADAKRHRNDTETNNATCVILQRAEKIDAEQEDGKKGERDELILKGRDVVVNVDKSYASLSGSASRHGEPPAKVVKVGFQKVLRKNIRQGQFVLIKNREMVPADIVLLASSNDQGGAYIETSSIDGETNLKLRTCPRLPKDVLKALREGARLESLKEEPGESAEDATDLETIEAASKRIARFSALGHPEGRPVIDHPEYSLDESQPRPQTGAQAPTQRTTRLGMFVESVRRASTIEQPQQPISPVNGSAAVGQNQYVAALVTEPPNASVHTFSGKLTLPPLTNDGDCHDIPLGAENVLLRGAVLRNTEWAIGLACFTGTDTKLIQNSHKTPPKFSQLDQLMNKTVLAILFIMFCVITFLASQAVATNADYFDTLFYAGFNDNTTEPWPYLPEGFAAPDWEPQTYNWLQYFFLYITLLTNFVPLSLYVTVEVVTVCNLWFMYADQDMYDDTTDTRAVARSTIVTDLGRIQYIFSDKTGTLTQNVMRFKRCSVDGMIFGAPIQKSRPGAPDPADAIDESSSFHPLRQLLVGRLQTPGLEGLGGVEESDQKLTLNAEMFLRVMSLCHTVVVEKDIDNKEEIDAGTSVSSQRSNRSGIASISKTLFGRKRANTADSASGTPLTAVHEKLELDAQMNEQEANRSRTVSQGSFAPGQNPKDMSGPDGAPFGYAYQAESPDEGALVTAASSVFGFQVITRDSSGITLRADFPSHFSNETTTAGLKDGTTSLPRLAAETASAREDASSERPAFSSPRMALSEERPNEKWQILAVNKFDSDRKRMSILLRSPPELGNLPILFCKGADSAMLEPGICSNAQMVQGVGDPVTLGHISKPAGIADRERQISALSTLSEDNNDEDEGIDQDGWEMAQMLGIQAHLGDFAKEGLRTLVLGMRILSEQQCDDWLKEYKEASISLTNRSELLTAAAKKIECSLHIVGATAIEDKLQVGVPHTIAQMEKAGIKLWVLTGDKRETAVEIGYSTHVLTPKMHLTEVPDNGDKYVRTQMAMEFIRLVKIGKLNLYQKSALHETSNPTMKRRIEKFRFDFGKKYRAMQRYFIGCIAACFAMLGMTDKADKLREKVALGEAAEEDIVEDIETRRRTRARAEEIIREWLVSEGEGNVQAKLGASQSEESEELSLASEEVPAVFDRATSAKNLLNTMRQSGSMKQADIRKLSIAHLTAQQAASGEEEPPLVDEDTLSLESFMVGSGGITNDFDKKKRTILERLFAIDKEVRKGRLMKHMTKTKLASIKEEALQKATGSFKVTNMTTGPRALVIEGAALKFLLGDPDLEDILFAVASQCDAVIACRVSPKQKALLVNLVRRNVRPEPVTLAIGDGANDVGMIQEAHVGVGISGKEGKQAVNASDFAISQFRFLEELILIHGRWNFFRLSTVVLFSFYKNAVMAGTLVLYAGRTLYSGTPLFDEWIIAMLNFVAAFPILFLGLFDRCLGKDYVKAHPEVFKATRENELITFRTLCRWVLLVFVHIFTIYYFTIPQQSSGGGISTAWYGLMRNNDDDATPGDGEGGDLKSVGTVTFSCLIVLLAYKVLYENSSLIHGRWPAFTCREGVGEGFASRLAYTWIGVSYLSIGFYFFAICTYQVVGRNSAGDFSNFTYVTNHVFGTRSMSWLLLAFVPICGIVFDVCGKLFSNMFYPTQTQIHREIEAYGKMKRRRIRESVARPNSGHRRSVTIDSNGNDIEASA